MQDGWAERGGARSRIGGRLIDAYTVHLLKKSHHLQQLRPLFRLKKSPLQDALSVGPGPVPLTARWHVEEREFSPGSIHPSFSAFHTLEIAREVKESVCRVADGPPSEDPRLFSLPTQSYELPDGTQLEVGGERFLMAELLLDPSPLLATGQDQLDMSLLDLLSSGHRLQTSAVTASATTFAFPRRSNQGYSQSLAPPTDEFLQAQTVGLGQLLSQACGRSESELPGSVWSGALGTGQGASLLASLGLLVVGGGGRCEGLGDRLRLEVEASLGIKVKVTPPPAGQERSLCAWLGGSIVGSLASAAACSDMWISRTEYEEFGPNIVDRKCP